MQDLTPTRISREQWRAHRRRRFRRRSRHAYIRSVYSLPSLATLGNAICGFGAIYVAALGQYSGRDDWTQWFAKYQFVAAAYLIFLAMVFDALDGRLARWARHTTDFGGQLDSLADVISFGAAPAFLALQLVRSSITDDFPLLLSRAIWAIGALYMSCAAIRLARFNVSNEHGEQHHFSFLGLPSPGAGGTIAAFVLMQQKLAHSTYPAFENLARACVAILPLLVLMTGLLMVSTIRYPHLVNRYLRGKRSLARLITMLALLLLLVVAHEYTLALGTLAYTLWGLLGSAWLRVRASRRGAAAQAAAPRKIPSAGE